MAEYFAQIDANKDGKLTSEEMQNAARARMQPGAAEGTAGPHLQPVVQSADQQPIIVRGTAVDSDDAIDPLLFHTARVEVVQRGFQVGAVLPDRPSDLRIGAQRDIAMPPGCAEGAVYQDRPRRATIAPFASHGRRQRPAESSWLNTSTP